jgi:glycosyltransferase involved in cell wall biosynthesis
LKTLGQGMMNVLGEKLKWVGGLVSRFNLMLVKTLLRDAVLADSVSVAQVEFLTHIFPTYADKIVWIDNAVNTFRFFPVPTDQARAELGLDKFGPVVGYVGTRPWERGGMQLIEAAPRLIQKYPNLGVVILGDGSEIEAMKKKAAELSVADRCIFTGYVAFHLVPLYINSLDVGVSISLRPDRSAASELKVRQYLACGKPVILSPGSNDFVVSENFGSIAQPTDLDAITHALDAWLSRSSDERQAFSERTARYMREHMSIEAAVARRLELWSAHNKPR